MFGENNEVYSGLDLWGRVIMIDDKKQVQFVDPEDVVSCLFGGWDFVR